MPEPSNVEMIGANTEPVRVQGADVRSAVVLDRDMGARVAESLRSPEAAAEDAGAPASADRVFLNLENVRARSDALSLAVYVGLPDDAEPAEHPELLADTVGLFGVSQASDPDEEHAGQGLTYVIEISKIVDHLHELGSFDVDALPVRIVPRVPVPEAAEVSIGRISIYRQGR